MKAIGIIAEFNPFHNGHKYLIDKAKKITKADCAVIVCSGNYVQRGMPSIIDKSLRTKMAILNGADAVFELPAFYSTASAELFAASAVKFLDSLNCIDYLCFGCESDNLKGLPIIASILSDEPEEYKIYLNDFIKTGISFPKARLNALLKYCTKNNIIDEYHINLIMSHPNNILAIEYLKAIKSLKLNLKPLAIKRLGAEYDSLEMNLDFASATGIRKQLYNNKYTVLDEVVPQNCVNILKENKIISIKDFNTVLGLKLISENDFSKYHDINSDLSNRINNLKSNYIGIEDFISELQSKNYTYSGISRNLFHILLNITQNDIVAFTDSGYFKYAHLLGFNRDSKILSLIKEKSELDIISKLSAYYSSCHGLSKKMLDISIAADELYRMIYMNKYGEIIPSEFERQIIIK